jgi:hypothetical protein
MVSVLLVRDEAVRQKGGIKKPRKGNAGNNIARRGLTVLVHLVVSVH